MPKGIYLHKKGVKKSEETRKKMSAAKKGKKLPPHTKEHRRKISETMKGKQLSTEHRQKISEANKKRPPFSEEWRKKMSLSHRGKKLPEEIRRKVREWNISNPNRKFKDTSIELKMEVELIKRNINYQKQVPLCKVAIVDFYLPEYRVVIQCDGCYYHGCPKHNPQWVKNKERDKNQDRVLSFNGFNVYRFWGHEINNSPEECINRILPKRSPKNKKKRKNYGTNIRNGFRPECK